MEPRSIGRYRLVQPVGRGGMGEVWRALDPAGRTVALKLLLAGRQATPTQRKRFASEAQALARVRHPGIVALLEAGEEGGLPFLVLEWIEGQSLAERLRQGGPLHPRDAATLVLRLARALAHAHEQGVLHRDLKPENVLLRGSDGAPLLVDFGLARALVPEPQVSAATRTGQWLGTPGWWPPEQARGERAAVGPRSDVFGLGAVLYAALTGRPPRQADSLAGELAALDRLPPPPGSLRAGVPTWLDAVCLRALQPDPQRRHPHAHALARELARGLGGRRARPAALLLVGAGGLVVALGLGAALLPGPRPAPPLDRPPSAKAPPEAAPTNPPTTPPDGAEPAPVPSAAAPPAPRPHAEEVAALLAQAEARARARDPGARDDLDQALTLDPACVQAWLYRGMLRQDLGDPDGALADLARALELDPGNARVWLERGTTRFALRQLRPALADLDRALELDPGLTAALINRGVTRHELGDLRGALADLELVVTREPANGHAFEALGRTRAALGDAAGARVDLDRALELGRGATAYMERALARRALGDLQGTLADFVRATELAPDDVRVWCNAGAARHELGDLAGARADLDRALALDPANAQARYNRALVRKDQGDARGALEDLDLLIAAHPQDPTLHCDRGLALQELGLEDQALLSYSQALTRDPGLGRAWLNRGLLQHRRGDPRAALSDLERALELLPDEPMALGGRGLARLALGDLDRAEEDLRRALAGAPQASWRADVEAGLARVRALR